MSLPSSKTIFFISPYPVAPRREQQHAEERDRRRIALYLHDPIDLILLFSGRKQAIMSNRLPMPLPKSFK